VAGLLDQTKVLIMKTFPDSRDLKYAFSLADVIELVAFRDNINEVNRMADRIDFKNSLT
jgi:hypothetical protein